MSVQTQPRQQLARQTQAGNVTEDQLLRLDEVAQRHAVTLATKITGRIQRLVATSRAISDLRALLTDGVMKEIVMPLAGSKLGFKMDRPGKSNGTPYLMSEIRDVVIQAMLQDFQLTGNEFNIISGELYGAKEGYLRKLREIPGVTDLVVAPGAPVNGAVRVGISCKFNGAEWCLRDGNKQPGRVYAPRGDSSDQLIGKAIRKAAKAAFEELTGTQITDADDGTSEIQAAVSANGNGSKASAIASQLAAKQEQPPAEAKVETGAAEDDDAAVDRIGLEITSLVQRAGLADAQVSARVTEVCGRSKKLSRLDASEAAEVLRLLQLDADASMGDGQ